MRKKSAIRVSVAAALAGTAILTSSSVVAERQETIPVSGSTVDFASEAIIHSQESTPTGMIQKATETVRLSGDLSGYGLYQTIREFDFPNSSLVVTGQNLFSGTIAGSGPVILRSDESRFEVDLATGEEVGHVHLTRSNDAPDKGSWYECDLVIVGTGRTPEGNFTSDYSGECVRRGRS
jgi:hypothetical protein